jgi:hypothetical protein
LLLIICCMLDFTYPTPTQYSEHSQYLAYIESLHLTKVSWSSIMQKGTNNRITLVVVLNPFSLAVSGCGCLEFPCGRHVWHERYTDLLKFQTCKVLDVMQVVFSAQL